MSLVGLVTLLAPLATATSVATSVTSPIPFEDGQFGYSVAIIGDIDGNSGGEALVGATGEALAGDPAESGLVHAFDGDGNLVRTYSSPNAQQGGDFGFAIAGVGDQNGDGRADFLVGAKDEDAPGPIDSAGRAYVISGLDGSVLRSLTSPNAEAFGRFGYSVAGIDDIDGDGRADFLIGASCEEVAGITCAGRAYVVRSTDGSLAYPPLQSPLPEAVSGFGETVKGLPDLTGDGVGDLAVAAIREDESPTLTEKGKVHLFDGATGAYLRSLSSNNTRTQDWQVGFGISIAALGDLDGDQVPDLLIGTNSEDIPGPPVQRDRGRVYLVSSTTGAILHTIDSPFSDPLIYFGFSVASLGDTDGDGAHEFAIGATGDQMPSTSEGARGLVHLYGENPPRLIASVRSPHETFNGIFGFSLAGGSDTDGDGRDDLLVGARSEATMGLPQGAGRAHLFTLLPQIFGDSFEDGQLLSWTVVNP